MTLTVRHSALTLNLYPRTHVRASLERPSTRCSSRWDRPTKRQTANRCRWCSRRGRADAGSAIWADNGHFWGHVQAIKRPTLLEITGPLFMSSPSCRTCSTA